MCAIPTVSDPLGIRLVKLHSAVHTGCAGMMVVHQYAEVASAF